MHASGNAYQTVNREDAFVDLAILEGNDVDDKWTQSDREYHLRQVYVSKKSIEIEDIFTSADKFVIVSGIAGIGKSTLVDTIILRWANGDLLNGKQNMPNIKLLLPFKCSNLNTSVKFSESYKGVLRKEFPILFEHASLEDLQEIRENILILVDGIDELQSVDGLFPSTKSQTSGIGDRFYDVIQRTSYMLFGQRTDYQISPSALFIGDIVNPIKCRFNGQKVLLAGRPAVCRKFKSWLQPHVPIKKVEVCGFNEANVKVYVEKAFQADTLLQERVLLKIYESENLQLMARIPIYLWVICGLYRGNTSIQAPKTTTELLLYACLIFIRNHLKDSGVTLSDSERSLKDLCEDNEILCYIVRVAKLSYMTLCEKKVVFVGDEVENIEDLERTGFIVKARNGEFGYVYQFRHMVLQEFFCSIHVFLSKSQKMQLVLRNANIRSCFPIITGLEGILSKEMPSNLDILQLFVKRLACHSLSSNISDVAFHTAFTAYAWLLRMFGFIVKPSVKSDLMDHLNTSFTKVCATETNPEGQSLNAVNIADFDIKMEQYLQCFFEYQGTHTTFLRKQFDGMVLILGVHNHSDHRAQHLLYFLEKIFFAAASLKIEEIHFANVQSENRIGSFMRYIQVCRFVYFNGFSMTYDQCCDLSENVVRLFESSTTDLEELDIRCPKLNGEALEGLVGCLVYLQKLTLTKAKITEAFSEGLHEALSGSNRYNLKSLSFLECEIVHHLTVQVCPLVNYLHCLELTSIRPLTVADAKYISQTIQQSYNSNTCKLKELSISCCDLYDEHFESLVDCVRVLNVVNLSFNKLTEDSLILLEKKLNYWNEYGQDVIIKHVDLKYNNFTVDVGESFYDKIKPFGVNLNYKKLSER